MPADFSVVAIVAAYNEADVVEPVIVDLIAQGVQVYFLDDGSTDETASIAERYVGRGVLAVERAPAGNAGPGTFNWEQILRRKTALARELDATWFIHHDADEFRESPWRHLSLKEAIQHVDRLGYNAIDFAGLDFWPSHDGFEPGADVREAFTRFKQPAAYDRLQIRCWKKADDLDLVSSGGHEARFHDRRVFPVRFILRHYPIRSQAHGDRKVFQERRGRFRDAERARRWHVQYDDVKDGESFLRDPANLTPFDADAFRVGLAIRHRGVEELEGTVETQQNELYSTQGELARTRLALEERTVEATALRAAVDARDSEEARLRGIIAAADAEAAALRDSLRMTTAELAAVRDELDRQRLSLDVHRNKLDEQRREIAVLNARLDERRVEVDRWRGSVDDCLRRLDAFERSRTWRWSAPARALFRRLTGASS